MLIFLFISVGLFIFIIVLYVFWSTSGSSVRLCHHPVFCCCSPTRFLSSSFVIILCIVFVQRTTQHHLQFLFCVPCHPLFFFNVRFLSLSCFIYLLSQPHSRPVVGRPLCRTTEKPAGSPRFLSTMTGSRCVMLALASGFWL